MIVCPNLSSIEGNSTYPNINWYNDEIHKNWLIVDETTESGKELAKRIKKAFPFIDLIIDDYKLIDIVEWPEISYTIDKSQLKINEVATIITEPNTIAMVDNQEYLLEDGVLEYSNENLGVYRIILKQERHKDVVIQIEVVE